MKYRKKAMWDDRLDVGLDDAIDYISDYCDNVLDPQWSVFLEDTKAPFLVISRINFSCSVTRHTHISPIEMIKHLGSKKAVSVFGKSLVQKVRDMFPDEDSVRKFNGDIYFTFPPILREKYSIGVPTNTDGDYTIEEILPSIEYMGESLTRLVSGITLDVRKGTYNTIKSFEVKIIR